MSQAYDFGKEAEKKAVEFLNQKGYLILHTNWFYEKKELDIVAQWQEYLVVVEVKALTYNTLQNPEDMVGPGKRRNIIQTADAYVQEHDIKEEVRFDIISVLKQGNQWEITHFEDAFNSIT